MQCLDKEADHESLPASSSARSLAKSRTVLQADTSSRSVRCRTILRRSDPRMRITTSAVTVNVSPTVTVSCVLL